MKTLNPWMFEAQLSSKINHYRNPRLSSDAVQGWLFEAVSPTRIVPSLIGRESSPFDSTIYVDINLGCTKKTLNSPPICPRPMTGIFIPENYSVTESVDLILYLQGHHKDPVIRGKAPGPRYYPSNLTINQYWDRGKYPFWAFREGVNASGKNVILVAPTLGSGSQTVALTQPGGLDSYLDQVMLSLSAYGANKGWKKTPRVGQIILACHSGGGWPMRQIALSRERYASNIRECWGFDCTYNTGDDTSWSAWAKAHPARKLFVYYIANSQTAPLATRLQNLAHRQRLSNVSVIKSSTGEHVRVPIKHWVGRIQSAPFLRDR
jgi:hypothetical protein